MKLILEGITKTYGAARVLDRLNLELCGPAIYCLMAPSGAGKTTLFRLILGLEQPDSGTILFEGTSAPEHDASAFKDEASAFENGRPLCSAVFQENRLFEHLNPVENLRLALGKAYSRDELAAELIRLLPRESLARPACTMSGGMKRRLAFVRAMLALSDLVLLDEPFTGLDEATRDLVIRYLLEHLNQRLIIIATHDREDAKKLGASLITL